MLVLAVVRHVAGLPFLLYHDGDGWTDATEQNKFVALRRCATMGARRRSRIVTGGDIVGRRPHPALATASDREGYM